MNKHDNYMAIARTVAQRSKCLKHKIGCVIIDDQGHIRATGYNGPPRGFIHCQTCNRDMNQFNVEKYFKEFGRLPECAAIHAEMNALLQLENKRFIDTMYCTMSPCIHCAKMICNTPIKTLYYEEEYITAPWETELRHELFKRAKIMAIHYKSPGVDKPGRIQHAWEDSTCK